VPEVFRFLKVLKHCLEDWNTGYGWYGSDQIKTKQNPRMRHQYKFLVPIDPATLLAG
jgi:hypothetical protein